MPRNGDRQQKLFAFLMEHERRMTSFTKDDVVEATGLSESSVNTYLSKKLQKVWVFPVDSQRYEVRGLREISLGDFREWMSQTSAGVTGTLEQWRVHLLVSLHIGVQPDTPYERPSRNFYGSCQFATPPRR